MEVHRNLPWWSGLLAGAFIAAFASAAGYASQLVHLMDVHPGVAGWVQAAGSIVALAVAIGVAAHQAIASRRLVEQQQKEQRRAEVRRVYRAAIGITAALNAASRQLIKRAEQGLLSMDDLDRADRMVADHLPVLNQIELGNCTPDLLEAISLLRITIQWFPETTAAIRSDIPKALAFPGSLMLLFIDVPKLTLILTEIGKKRGLEIDADD